MNDTDPRHGSRAGYVAGCRLECCRVPHCRYQKRSTLRRLREGGQYVDPIRVRLRIAEWAESGVTIRGIALAAGLSDTTLTEMVRHERRIEKPTERAVLAVTWGDLPDSTLVYADLTRRRIGSLMAAGHTLGWICAHVDKLSVGGKWRSQERVSLGIARQVMALHETAATWGPCSHTAAKATNRGHLPPAGWDDPGVPAVPQGWQPEEVEVEDGIDEAVVLRVMAGDLIKMTPAERTEVVARLRAKGLTYTEIERHTGITKIDRHVKRNSEVAA